MMLGAAMLACSPTYNWREIRTPRWTAMFPAKPATGERTLPLLGSNIQLALQSAEVEHTVFAIGVADLPESLGSTPETRSQVAKAFEAALLHNIGGHVERDAGAPTEAWTKNGVVPLPEVAREVAMRSGRDARRVTVRIYVTPMRVYEVIVSSDSRVEPQEQTELFFAGFKPI